MSMNIIAAVMTLVAVGFGAFGWWVDHRDKCEDEDDVIKTEECKSVSKSMETKKKKKAVNK